MTGREVTNIAASIQARLKNKAKAENRRFDELIHFYAMERFLARFAASHYADKLVLKGALRLVAASAKRSRPTKDIDMLGIGIDNDIDVVVDMVREVCDLTMMPDDGMRFDTRKVRGDIIDDDGEYKGVRCSFIAYLGGSEINNYKGAPRINMQIDVGFGDIISSEIHDIVFPSTLPGADPIWVKGYPLETVIAEKFEAMHYKGILNSRARDFYDIWLLSRIMQFSASELASAIKATFDKRGTQVTLSPPPLSDEFAAAGTAAKVWPRWLRLSDLTDAPTDFAAVQQAIRDFLLPVCSAIVRGKALSKTWHPGDGWR